MTTPAAESRFSICLIENDLHELLFLRRARDAKIGANQWGFPAGHIEAGETPDACASREINEEIGLEHELHLKRSLPPVRDTFYGGKYEIHLFHFEWRSGDIVLNHEHSTFRWVSKSEFSELDRMLGVDEDILLLNIWPLCYLDATRLPTN